MGRIQGVKEQIEKMSYTIHSFMSEGMGLGGGELLIYAIIYSFTKGEGGVFFGTQNYLARASGLSVSTVKRAISGLVNKGYIERKLVGKKEGYCSIEPTGLDRWELDAEGPPNDAERKIPTAKELGEESIDLRDELAGKAGRPKYEFHCVGMAGLVCMTAEQYKRLLSLVGSETLSGYIRRLELLIEKQGYKTFNPYKTIKRWIFEDAAV
jgi:hypothetical protein